MAVEEVQQLLELLRMSPEVTELTVQGSSGGKVTLKRHAPPAVPPVVVGEPAIEFANDEAPTFPGVAPASRTRPVTATMVGVYHDVNPPLQPGASLLSGQIVGYIESMRLMNEVVSTVDGVVEAAVISDGQPVEYGQSLFTVTESA